MIRLTMQSGTFAIMGDHQWESEDAVFADLLNELAKRTRVSYHPLFELEVAREIAAKIGATLEISDDELEVAEIDPNVIY